MNCFQVPPVGMQHLEEYLIQWQGRDKEILTEVRAMQHGKRMTSKVHGLSHFSDKQHHYFSGATDAEMKKTVIYSIRFRLDANGEVQFSTCECAAGAGSNATCKHIVAALLVLIQFKKEGILEVEQSSTDVLQSFKKPKRTAQSPKKAQDMGSQETDLNDDDPRPKKYRNRSGYQDEVNMLTVNYCSYTNRDSSWRYKFRKANIQQASKEHDYDTIPITEL